MKKYILIDELGMSNSMRAYTDSELEAFVDELIEIKSESDPSFIVDDKSTDEWLRYFNYEIKEAKVLTVEQLEEVYTDLSDTVSMEEELDWIAEGVLFLKAMEYYYANSHHYEQKWGSK